MKYLLDTHAFLWYITEDEHGSEIVADIIEDLSNIVYLSVVSIWEILLKYQKGKLPLDKPAKPYLIDQRNFHQIASLELDEKSIMRLLDLPSLHHDPFDRMLICQSLTYDLTLLTKDQNIRRYPVQTLF